MATKPLIHYAFLLSREKLGPGHSEPHNLGFFYARATAVRFFGIEDKAQFAFQSYRKGYTRIKTLADGNTLAGSDAQVNESFPIRSAKARPTGGRKVIITTGKPTVAEGKNYHTVSFNFPQWAKSIVIATALGALIEDNKFSLEPSENQAQPFFLMQGGRKYPIKTTAAANSNQLINIATNDSEADTLIKKKNANNKTIDQVGT